MSNVWGTQYRLYVEELEAIADRISENQQMAPAVAEEQAVRLLATVARLLRQHEVNKRGQCNFCCRTRWGWRLWRWRPRCTVFRAVSFALGQPLDVAWWQVFAAFDRNTSLAEVREWVGQRWWNESPPGEPGEDEGMGETA